MAEVSSSRVNRAATRTVALIEKGKSRLAAYADDQPDTEQDKGRLEFMVLNARARLELAALVLRLPLAVLDKRTLVAKYEASSDKERETFGEFVLKIAEKSTDGS